MVFSSLVFLFAFFPLSLLAYSLCREKKTQNIVLLLFSLVFYLWGEPKYILLLLFMALSAWACALAVEKAHCIGAKRFWLVLSCVVDIGMIGWFKYAALFWSIFGPVPQFVKDIVLPIGISFYTFQLMSYVVDVYRGESPAQKSYLNVLLYAALFHQCIAGPIVRYKTISQELFGPELRRPEVATGVSRFCAGLAKKVLLANPCGALADSLLLANGELFASNLEHLQGMSVLGAWTGLLAYGLHMYLDFSAYSDMAIGMGIMLGLHYPENFNYPYISRSITEFWRRWHISLGVFFRDYVYIPLGGNRGSRLRVLCNTLIVWFLTGLWHGASWNFALWGLWFFLLLMLERAVLKPVLKKLRVFSHVYTLLAVLVGWAIFKFTDLRLLGAMLGSLVGAHGNALTDFTTSTLLMNNCYLLAVAILTSTPLTKLLKERLGGFAAAHGGAAVCWNILAYSLVPVVLLLLSTAGLVGDSYNPFLYFRF